MHHLESITHVIQNFMMNAQNACVAVRLGVFSTTVSNRPCRVSWVCRIYLTSRNFDFHIMLSKMHDIYNYQNPNPEMPTKNGFEINVCKDDFA